MYNNIDLKCWYFSCPRLWEKPRWFCDQGTPTTQILRAIHPQVLILILDCKNPHHFICEKDRMERPSDVFHPALYVYTTQADFATRPHFHWHRKEQRTHKCKSWCPSQIVHNKSWFRGQATLLTDSARTMDVWGLIWIQNEVHRGINDLPSGPYTAPLYPSPYLHASATPSDAVRSSRLLEDKEQDSRVTSLSTLPLSASLWFLACKG